MKKDIKKNRSPKVVLAYSGGLDTSVMVHWLKKRGYNVIACCLDLGQKENWDSVKRRAIQSGAGKVVVINGRKEFVNDYVSRAILTNAVYENGYYLATALGRPLIGAALARVAIREKAAFLAHGCTGKGNDQVRIELASRAIAPAVRILAPVREWEFATRDEEIAYARANGIRVQATKAKPYSLDINLWGSSIECGVLEDPWQVPPEDAYELTVSPKKAPNKPQVITLKFRRGLPVALNGKAMGLEKLIVTLGALAGKHGAGRSDLVEDRLVGIKSREIYEAPAAAVIIKAHRALESMCLPRETLSFADRVSSRYARLIYDGGWFTSLRRGLDAFVDSIQATVTGTVRIELFKGNVTVTGRQSSTSLYRKDLATYDEGDTYDQKAAEGFIRIFGLPVEVEGIVHRKSGGK